MFQPHLPVRLPCYDLAPITSFALGRSLRLRTSGTPGFHGLTGGVYKARERIHRAMADARLLANPASWGRVADLSPNWDRLLRFDAIYITKGSNIDISDVKITFKPNLPINTNDLASIINQLKGILPLETLIGWLPDIDDPAEQLQKLEEEQSKSIQNQQQALGNGTLPKFDEVAEDEEG